VKGPTPFQFIFGKNARALTIWRIFLVCSSADPRMLPAPLHREL